MLCFYLSPLITYVRGHVHNRSKAMPFADPNDLGFNPATEVAPQIQATEQLIDKMNTLLSSIAVNLPALKINTVDKGRVISVMDALARDRDTVQSGLNCFRKEINKTNALDIEMGVPITLYGCINQYSSELELHASNFAGHMTSFTSIESIAKIIG